MVFRTCVRVYCSVGRGGRGGGGHREFPLRFPFPFGDAQCGQDWEQKALLLLLLLHPTIPFSRPLAPSNTIIFTLGRRSVIPFPTFFRAGDGI